MKDNLEVTVAHQLPGRIRIRLAPRPKDYGMMVEIVKRHPGVQDVSCTSETQGIVVKYDQKEIAAEEIILRISLSLSRDYDLGPVRIKTREPREDLSSLSYLAGLALLTNHILRLTLRNFTGLKAVSQVSALTTLAAVLEHSLFDIRRKGYFHPEVFSVYYLLYAFIKGNALKGSTVTWLLTFARHILEMPQRDLVVKAVKTDPTCHVHRCEYEVIVTRHEAGAGPGSILRALPNLAFNAYRKINAGWEDTLFQQMQTLAQSHRDVIEGLEDLQPGILLKVKI